MRAAHLLRDLSSREQVLARSTGQVCYGGPHSECTNAAVDQGDTTPLPVMRADRRKVVL